MSSGRKTCLLCSRNNCLVETDNEGENYEVIFCAEVTWLGVIGKEGVLEGWEFPSGSENCLKSKRQMVTHFVLKKVLDIPEDCWRKLINGKSLDSWIQICEDCLSTAVDTAWKIHREILALAERFRDVKEEIKETMRDRMVRMKKRRIKSKNGDRVINGRGAVQAIHEEIVRLAFNPRPPEISKVLAAVSATEGLNIVQEGDHRVKDHQNEGYDSSGGDEGANDDGSSFEPTVDDDNDQIDDVSSTSSSDEEYEPTSHKKRKIWKKSNGFSQSSTSKREKKSRRRTSGYCRTCAICNSRYRTSEDYESHMTAHEENDALGDLAYNCPQCKFPCKSTIELDIHIHHRHVIPSRLKTYKCPLCSFQSKVWKDLKRHIDAKHPSATEEELGPEVFLKCAECGFQATNPNSFHSHQKQAHPQKFPQEKGPVQCPDCRILFDSQDKLHFHTVSTHKRQERFICETCGKGFTRKMHLDNHKVTHERHHKPGDFVCDICGMDYAYKFTLDDHYKKFHSSNSKRSSSNDLFKCRYCDLTSPFSNVIRRHLQKHKEENGHRCDKCGKYYMNPQGLRRHLIINHPVNQDEQFPCQYCFKTYSNLNALQGHIKYFCGVKKLMEQKVSLPPQEPTVEDGKDETESPVSMTTAEVGLF